MYVGISRRIHRTWLFTVACGGVVLGVVLSRYTEPVWLDSPGWLLIAVVLIIAAMIKQRRAWLVAALLAGLFCGMWRGNVELGSLTALARAEQRMVVLSGKVSEDVELTKRSEKVLRVDNLSADSHPLAGTIWATTTDERVIRRGDVVELRGRLESGFGSFSGAMYQAIVIDVRRPEPGDVALVMRDNFSEHIRTRIDEPMASLGIGYLLGQRRDLPNDFSEALQIAGLTHIVVASGYNLTILVRLARRRFENISKYLATAVPLGLVVGFIAMTGASPSMTRAGIVTGFGLLAWYYGRNFHPVTLILFAACITVLIKPSYAWGDIGWLLSFAAFAGVMLLAPLLHAYFFGEAQPSGLRQTLIETVSAQVVTAPILIVAFGKISLIALVSNILVLPLVPLAMLLVFLTGAVSYAWPLAAASIAHVTQLLLSYMVVVTEWCASVSWAQQSVTFGPVGALIFYTVLLALCIYMWKATGYRLHKSNIVT